MGEAKRRSHKAQQVAAGGSAHSDELPSDQTQFLQGLSLLSAGREANMARISTAYWKA
jgi:hypothetical protein